MADLVYDYLPPSGDITRHIWTLVGPNGAVHVWAEPTKPEFTNRWGEAFFGGIEIHSKKRLYGDGAPDHPDCWLLKCPCWHDGSSLQFSEQVEPTLRRSPVPFPDAIHEFVNSILFDWYQHHFTAEDVSNG